MANKYANLVGTNKIKDEYTKINTGFDGVETDIDALNDLVGVSAQEIIDARVGETSLGSKMRSIDSQLAEMLNYSTVAAVTDVYTIDFANSPVKNVKIETEDTNAKTVALANVPTDAELFIELTYTNAAAIIWFAGIIWLSGAAPTFETGKVYRIALFKYGTGWHGNCVGGW